MALASLLQLLLVSLPAASLAWADWCKWIPVASQIYVPECSGYGYRYPGAVVPWTYGCASWCRWVPGPSWGYTPQCVGCYQLYSGSYKSASPTANLLALEDGCKTSCQWLSQVSWNSTADCAKCEQPLQLKTGEEAAAAPRLKVKLQVQRPNWCQWVPLGSLQYVNECNTGVVGAETTSGTGGCAGWCGWSPVSSWQYIPECTQCSANEGSPTVVAGAGCENWCQWVSRPSWQNVGNCSGCEALSQANSNELRP